MAENRLGRRSVKRRTRDVLSPLAGTDGDMVEVFRTNDLVALSFAEALLKGEGIASLRFDQNISVMEGSIGVFPRRLMVDDDDETAAKDLLRIAELI